MTDDEAKKLLAEGAKLQDVLLPRIKAMRGIADDEADRMKAEGAALRAKTAEMFKAMHTSDEYDRGRANERAAIVTFLLSHRNELGGRPYGLLASWIERGDHLRGR